MSAASITHRGRPRSDRARGAPATATPRRIRWDRVGRLAMLCVLVALVYLYLSAGVRMLTTWRQSRHDASIVTRLEREHRMLLRQHESLTGQAALERHARLLMMARPNERTYVISGLPND
jgi:hypothetical protein